MYKSNKMLNGTKSVQTKRD